MSGISSQFEFGSCLDYGSRATVGVGYGPAEDGLRARYAPASGGLYYLFLWDPQGSVQQRHTDGSYTGGFAAYDRSTFEGYGALRQANKGSTGAIVGQHDPAGFGGQFGYYTDTETGLLCLTHRYYDPGAGKFINRDPIGYQGGANLYGFCEGNPVNKSDPSGLATVEVRYRQVMLYDSGKDKNYWGTWGYHAYIVVTDTDGAQYEIAGGPVRKSNSQYPIYVRHSEYKYRDKHGHKAYDFPIPGDHVNRPPSTVLIKDNKSAWYYMNRFIAVGDLINKAQIEYSTLYTNSNSTIREIIQRSNTGLKPPTKRPVWTPGWDNELPIESGHDIFNGYYGQLR